MEQIELEVSKRGVLGKKVRFLRRQGMTPVHLFGHGIKSMALQCDTARIRQVLAKAGHTRLVSLKLDSERNPRNVFIQEVQIEPRTDKLFHVDLYQVRMTERMKVEVPVVLVGETPALKLKENMLVQELNTLAIECLPGKIPPSIELDVSSLVESDQAIRVKDINLDRDIIILNDPQLVVAKISVRRIEKVVEKEVAVAEAPEAVTPEEGEPKRS